LPPPLVVSREDGARLREAILANWNSSEPLELDFQGVRVASVSFFDESIGLLALQYPPEDISAHVRGVNIGASDRSLLNKVVSERIRERTQAHNEQE
jgi:hypothetical protein